MREGGQKKKLTTYSIGIFFPTSAGLPLTTRLTIQGASTATGTILRTSFLSSPSARRKSQSVLSPGVMSPVGGRGTDGSPCPAPRRRKGRNRSGIS